MFFDEIIEIVFPTHLIEVIYFMRKFIEMLWIWWEGKIP